MGLLVPSGATILTVTKIVIPLWILYVLGLAIYRRYFHPLRHYPGNFWASITDLWYFGGVRYGLPERHSRPLHDQYGSFVRVGPNTISIAEASAIPQIYGPNTKGVVWNKSKFYSEFASGISPRLDAFCERDEAKHSQRRRIVAPLYTQSSVLSYEPQVDRIIELFYSQMEKFVASGEVFDMSVWLRKYTFDVIGEIFYGRKGGFGMIRDNIDYGNWCALMDTMPQFGSAQSYVPPGTKPLYMIAQLFEGADARKGLFGFFEVIKQAKAAAQERHNLMKAGKEGYGKDDMLTKLIEIHLEREAETGWTMKDVATELWAVIWAGSDTTAIALTSIFWHLHKNPTMLDKLRAEVNKAFDENRLSYPVRYNDANKLPYLTAVIKEAMRVHHSLGTGLPRDVPPGGADICGRFVPGGTTVIMNGNVVQFDKKIFGDDADEFVPERWTRDGPEKVAYMERHILTFGYGPRICIGKWITHVEMYKLLPTVLRDFDFELLAENWTVSYTWFQGQKGVNVRASTRRIKEGRERPNLVTDAMR